MLVAETDGRVVGFRALMRWRFLAPDGVIEAVRPVDTATHPDFQGQGIFSRLTRAALDSIRGDVDLVFNTPNSKSLPGYLKMGWTVVGSVPISVRIRRPVRFALGVRTRNAATVANEPGPAVEAETATSVLGTDRVLDLVAAADLPDPRIHTRRDLDYLRWRYGSAPGLDYRGMLMEEGGTIRGLALFRVRPRGRLWETTVDELIVAPGDRRAGAAPPRPGRSFEQGGPSDLPFPHGLDRCEGRGFRRLHEVPRRHDLRGQPPSGWGRSGPDIPAVMGAVRRRPGGLLDARDQTRRRFPGRGDDPRIPAAPRSGHRGDHVRRRRSGLVPPGALARRRNAPDPPQAGRAGGRSVSLPPPGRRALAEAPVRADPLLRDLVRVHGIRTLPGTTELGSTSRRTSAAGSSTRTCPR